jgi:hypothetical protein
MAGGGVEQFGGQRFDGCAGCQHGGLLIRALLFKLRNRLAIPAGSSSSTLAPG